MQNLSARSVLYGTLPFAAALIDEVLTTIPPAALSDNELEMWDVGAVRLACCQRSGVKAEFFSAEEDEEVVIEGDEEYIHEPDADELSELEADEAKNETWLQGIRERIEYRASLGGGDDVSECEQLARVVAPELMDRPLYVLDVAELPWLTQAAECCSGFAMRDFVDVNIKAALGDRWQGAGPVIVLQPHESKAELLRTMLHEIAHVVPAQTPTVGRDNPLAKLIARRAVEASFDLPEAEPETPDDCHDWRFIRRALHLFVRATAAGFDVPICGLFRQWWQPREPWWVVEILSEAQTKRAYRFAELEQTPPPPGFLAIWQNALDLYHNRLGKI